MYVNIVTLTCRTHSIAAAIMVLLSGVTITIDAQNSLEKSFFKGPSEDKLEQLIVQY